VAEEIAIRLHHNVAQVYANAHSRFARFGEFERGFDSGKARTKVQHEAVAGGVEYAAAVVRGYAFYHFAQRR
jgi:hypothetical protein